MNVSKAPTAGFNRGGTNAGIPFSVQVPVQKLTDTILADICGLGTALMRDSTGRQLLTEEDVSGSPPSMSIAISGMAGARD